MVFQSSIISSSAAICAGLVIQQLTVRCAPMAVSLQTTGACGIVSKRILQIQHAVLDMACLEVIARAVKRQARAMRACHTTKTAPVAAVSLM